MTPESLYRVLEKVRTFKEGDADAITQALNEIESLFFDAKAKDRLKEFVSIEVRSTIDAIACKRETLTAALIRWLPDDNVRELTEALCFTVGVHYLRMTAAVRFDLAGSNRGRAGAVALRLVANNAPPALSLGWLLALASEHAGSDDTMALVEELMSYHVNELPISTAQVLANDKNPLVSLKVACDALGHLQEIDAHLKNLPEAREFFMPPDVRLMHASVRRKRNRAINAGADKQSILASLFKTRRFKYSTRTAVEVHHDNRTEEMTLTMTPHSLSVELPLSEMTDPMAAYLQRQSFSERGAI